MAIDVKSLTPAGQGNYQKVMQGTPVFEHLEKLTQDPMKYNTELLLQIVQDNKDTEFGRKHGFADIHTVEDFQRLVPISKYDDYADEIWRMTEEGESNLICSYPIHHYNKSSGTMGNPKRLPMSEKAIEISNRYLLGYLNGLLGQKLGMDWIDGKSISLTESAASVNTLKCGATYGAVSVKMTLQYRPYVADGPYVRKQSISGDTLPDGTKENRSYFGHKACTTNEGQLDQILEMAGKAKELGVPSVVAMFAGAPMCFHEFESAVDGIVITFCGASLYGGANASSEALARIIAGVDEPSGLLPLQMPKNMDDVERQAEDTPRDMECYTDSVGHKYDFAYGLNYAGVINDDRVKTYSAAPVLRPANKGV